MQAMQLWLMTKGGWRMTFTRCKLTWTISWLPARTLRRKPSVLWWMLADWLMNSALNRTTLQLRQVQRYPRKNNYG